MTDQNTPEETNVEVANENHNAADSAPEEAGETENAKQSDADHHGDEEAKTEAAE